MAKNRTRTALRPTLVSLAVASCFSASTALANPTGANVVRGTAAIHQTGNLLQITNSPNAIINWQSFSIGANEITRFLQQSPSSAVLNRVTTQNPSQILGSLQSKLLDGVTTGGRVFLINPNGILFGAGAQIDVGGLVASTLRMSDDDFLAGRMRFGDGLGKSVVNDGSIATSAGGSVYLIGSGVTNNGIIRSPQGEVILAAGNSVELVSPGTPNLRVEIAALDNEARNLGQIISDAGRIGIYAGLINNSGTIRADSAVSEGGRILLKASKGAVLESTSVLGAQGQGGGDIRVLADESVHVAGRLDASAPNAGDGGFIETSAAKVSVSDASVINASAPHGKSGTWLIDPPDFIIAAGVLGDITGLALSQTLERGTDVLITSNDGLIQPLGNGDIFVNDAVTWSTTNSLTLTAVRFVQVNKPLTGPNGGVFLNSGGGVMQGAEGAITANQLYANGGTGSVLLDAASNRVNVLAGDATGAFSFVNGQSLQIGALPNQQSGIQVTGTGPASVNINVTSGNLNVAEPISAQARGQNTASISLSAAGDITTTAAGSITADFSTGNNGGGNASVALSAGGSITVGGPIVAQGNFGSSDNGGGVGGNATVSISAGTSLAVDNTISATAGNGDGVRGGDATVMLSAGGALTVNSSVTASGGAGGQDFGSGADGGAGGNALVTLTGGSISLAGGGTINATGGAGGLGGSGSSSGSVPGGNGGIGGNATVSLMGGSISLVSGHINANGGIGGAGGDVPEGGAGGVGGNGGNATAILTGSSIELTGSTIFINGGKGGDGGAASFASGAGGNGGNGGSAAVTMSGSTITVDSSSNVSASGGGGGNGGSNTFDGGPAGIGGNGGGATVSLTGSSIAITNNSSVGASGGFGGRGGDVLNASGGAIGGNGGTGGVASVMLTSGGITVMDGSIFGFGGGGGFGGSGSGGVGVVGNGGAAAVTLDGGAGGISVTTSGGGQICGTGCLVQGELIDVKALAISRVGGFGVFAVGGNGGNTGGAATAVLNTAGGISVIGTDVGAAGGGASIGTGGNAQATLTSGGDITLASSVFADGGPGTTGDGTGRIDLIFLTSGTDFVVNGVRGLIFDTSTIPGSGFMVDGAAAILNVNLFVTQNVTFTDTLVATMNQQADVLADQLRAGETGEGGEDKDKKKLPFCSG